MVGVTNMIDGIDYGPLAQLVGRWVGDKGLDVAPDADAKPDQTHFTDELSFEAAGSAENAEEQELVSVRYHHVVRKSDSGLVFHEQVGHWIFEPATGLLMHSLSIPRAVCVLAGGGVVEQDGETIFDVKAQSGSETFGIVQSPFMLEKAKTKAFHMRMSVKGNQLSYSEVMSLHIYGKDFEHTDASILTRVSAT